MRTFSRSRILLASAVSLPLFALGRAPARAAQFSYRMGHPSPADSPPTIRFAQMSDAIKNETGGRMELAVFPNSQLGSPEAMLGQLRLGSIQFANFANADFASVVPVAQIDCVCAAFTSRKQAFDALDGPLGAYIRAQFVAKGLFAFDRADGLGFRQVTTSTHPIRTADDCPGMKIRAAPAAISTEFWKALGASPTYISTGETYTGLQTHLMDGMETPMSSIETYRFYEVQKYLSITNHTFNGAWVVGNGDAWKALPPDIQGVVSRNMRKSVLQCRADFAALDDAAPEKLKARGLIVNAADTASIRARLGAYYAHWKSEFGPAAWSLLEASTGKLS